jgi:hypothetical protein
LITCTDNLKGFTDAIKSSYPKTLTQLCVVHQFRNSCPYVVWKDKKEFVTDLKAMYAASNQEAAANALDEFESNREKNMVMQFNPGELTGKISLITSIFLQRSVTLFIQLMSLKASIAVSVNILDQRMFFQMILQQ